MYKVIPEGSDRREVTGGSHDTNSRNSEEKLARAQG